MTRAIDRTDGGLAIGRHTEPAFTPSLSFAVERADWVARQVADGLFDIQLGPVTLDVVAVQFCRPLGFFGAGPAEVRTTSVTEAVEVLRRNPALAVGPACVARVGTRAATTIDVETTAPRDSDPPVFDPVLTVAAGPIAVASARRLRISLLALPDGLLGVLVGGSIAAWDAALAVSEPVVASIRLTTP